MFAHNDPDWLEVSVVSKSIGVGVLLKKIFRRETSLSIILANFLRRKKSVQQYSE